MTVSRILERKGSAVVTVPPSASLQQVIDTLARNQFGVVVVVGAAQDLLGIVSERDVIRALAGDAAAAVSRTAGEVMSRSVATCTPEEAESEVMARMDAKGVRHLPVLAGGRLVGIVSLRDVVRLRLEKIDELMASITREAEKGRA